MYRPLSGVKTNIYGYDREDLAPLWEADAGSDRPFRPGPHGGTVQSVCPPSLQPRPSDEARGVALRQIFKALYLPSVGAALDGGLPVENLLSKRWRRALSSAGLCDLSLPIELVHFERSPSDGSVKMVMRPVSARSEGGADSDGGQLVGHGSSRPGEDWFESVLIPERGRLTQCVSSQIGCAQACRFCQTGRMGLRRNLSAAEIVAQVLLGNRVWRQHGCSTPGFGAPQVTNVVFMGMGEPLDNPEAVLKACRIISEPLGLAVGSRHITISTVGLKEGLEKVMTQSSFPLALSLHSPFDAERSRIMPVNKAHPIREVLEILGRLRRGREEFFIQYTLIRGVNDSIAHAEALADLLKPLPCKVNLIPLNEHDGAAFRRPGLDALSQFRGVLRERGLVVTVRFSKGRDIEAACGQLVKEQLRRTSGHPPLM
jgi:23S rRNA (adenine2503-C2)-methyltransferase